IIHARNFASWYTVLTLRDSVPLKLAIAAGSAAILMLLLTLTIVLLPAARRRVSTVLTSPRWEPLVSWGLPAVVATLAIYAYFIRPLGSQPVLGSQISDARLALMNTQQSFVRLGWFVTPIGLAFGVLGWMIILRSWRNRLTALPILLIATDAYFFLADARITPVYYWAARRWIPLVIPGVCLGIAVALVWLAPRTLQNWKRMFLPIGVAAILLVELFPNIQPLLGYVEYRGAVSQLGKLASDVPPNSVVLFANGDAGTRFSVPMEYIFERTSILVPKDVQVDDAIVRAARLWASQGRPIYWIGPDNSTGPQQIGLTGQVTAKETISLPEKIATSDGPPGADGIFKVTVAVWRLSL
ncbi:MAG TPA: hypothetical protein VMW65_03850, partial [Chloroflexota bacterium]|nr:hypothetical protein [Chloroflexota bacterium]